MSAPTPTPDTKAPRRSPVPLRFVTAASLFDGHDASINIMRRVLQSRGAEVIHLGHDRSVEDIVKAAIEEDAHAIAVSSYQGGHVEFFTFMVERLAERGRPDILVFGGGGGTITDREIALLHSRGVARIYSVEDGRRMGLVGMIDDMLERADRDLAASPAAAGLDAELHRVARTLTQLETLHHRQADGDETAAVALGQLRTQVPAFAGAPVIGVTGTGGAGKSSLTDEIVRRFVVSDADVRIAVLSVDPSKRRTGGALLGDRIRMNTAGWPRVMVRSLATRRSNAAVSDAIRDALSVVRRSSFDLVIVETAGIGQSGSEVVDLADISLYVMTPEYGAPSQLEKIDMLDLADIVAINKSDKVGAEDARRNVARQVVRNRQAFASSPDDMPVYSCCASRFGDPGVDRLFDALVGELRSRFGERWGLPAIHSRAARDRVTIPASRNRYLAEIATAVRRHHKLTGTDATNAALADGIRRTLLALGDAVPAIGRPYAAESPAASDAMIAALRARYDAALQAMASDSLRLLQSAETDTAAVAEPENRYRVREREIVVENYTETLSGTKVPKVAVPRTKDWGEIVRWRRSENLPGAFPYAAGVFPYKRQGEDPTRMFAGEGMPERTNRRFHFVSQGQPAVRLSTAFDSVTLYGRNPDRRPDIWGKVGNSGVSVATLDDAKRLYSGFDLSAPTTSVSMTINGPAPAILAMFLNTAIDQAVERRLRADGRWAAIEARLAANPNRPVYRGVLPDGHDGIGLGLLGCGGEDVVSVEEYAQIRCEVLSQIRGTVQADILKEDQAQNTCIFSTEFALRMMGDIQEFFVTNDVRNFYSVSISGYHIAEAGANPITQLAFTLANGFTFVEYYRSRGMNVDDFARNLSFFFSNGIDAEYAVIGRVARRIWAIAMRDLYSAGPRSQQLKYHIQTSGRSLHAQEIDFNDIRTTLQALYAIADNCNSLHTNAYDEAITTPTEASVRRALAIQLIINRELGLTKNENPLQGAWLTDYLTDVVEEAVLAEFERIAERGGVLGAMELMYQRSRIQEESLTYEHKKHSGELPIIGVNTFIDPKAGQTGVVETELVRSDDDEKQAQIDGLLAFRAANSRRSAAALSRLQKVALDGGNLFAELMDCVKCCPLGDITDALFEVGGQYRRNM